ncbi:transglycosylase SLT domain-containing protein [Nonomuraea longicatena]|uniref:Transglycosylase SLT domain-containing protein n=1 Tax=Nonomuraea longicatena TaxID=83682 RepID=A0ABN1P669_9ACTN
MINSAEVRKLPGGEGLAAIMDKVAVEPGPVRDLARRWRNAGDTALDYAGGVGNAVGKVDRAWQGTASAEFTTYMTNFRKAGDGLDSVLSTCAGALDRVADELTTARREIDGIAGRLLDNAAAYSKQYFQDNPDAAKGADEAGVKRLATAAAKDAEPKLTPLNDAVTDATTLLTNKLKDSGGFTFSDFKSPTPEQFVPVPGEKGWVRTPGYQPAPGSGGTGGGAGDGDGGVGGGGGGSPGYEYGGVSNGGGAPAPKAEVVEWIKKALEVIKSPEMAAVLAERGLDVADLDPNDPQDIQRIWTIIHHESGGNPSAVNNWDINAKNGVPSQGLMQTIPPTFNAHSLPGYKEILSPVDNIIAGVLYTYSRYGDLGNHPGIESLESGGGYRPY